VDGKTKSANFSAQNLHRQKSLIFTFIFQIFERIQRFGAVKGTAIAPKNGTI
jgi:hypothetical protein